MRSLNTIGDATKRVHHSLETKVFEIYSPISTKPLSCDRFRESIKRPFYGNPPPPQADLGIPKRHKVITL